ncbi:MAG TPA: ADP-dependent glucokinase/phosphofructokinase [Streptosporangiaceae bacterium]
MNVSWRDAYVAVAGRVAEQAPKARLMFTGASACVDAIFPIGAERLGRLARGVAVGSPGGSADGRAGAELLARVMARVVDGRGGELLTRWSDGPSWVFELLGPPDRHQVGGTGPQASWALAVAGAESVLALADRSAEQLAVIDPRVGLCSDGSIVAAGSVAPSGTPAKLPHCILEFTAGTSWGGMMVPRSSRIILRFGDEPIECDEQFLTVTSRLASVAGAGLLSGLNTLAEDNLNERLWLAALGRAWSDGGLPVIHHELAEFPSLRRLRDAVTLGGATSLGMSLSELFMLAGTSGDPRLLARDAADLSGVRRVIVHADDWALAVHRDDPRQTRDVLLTGNSFAAARARAGQPSSGLEPAPEAAYTDRLPLDGPLGDGWQATSVPAPHIPRPAGTVGLGDTFVAGVLLAESLPDHN